jgi:hypothetical protein
VTARQARRHAMGRPSGILRQLPRVLALAVASACKYLPCPAWDALRCRILYFIFHFNILLKHIDIYSIF